MIENSRSSMDVGGNFAFTNFLLVSRCITIFLKSLDDLPGYTNLEIATAAGADMKDAANNSTADTPHAINLI